MATTVITELAFGALKPEPTQQGFTGMEEVDSVANNSNITSAFLQGENHPFPLFGHYIIGGCLALIGLIGIIQNVSVLTFFYSEKELRTEQVNQLVCGLMVSDLLMCLWSLPFAVVSSFHSLWIFGENACKWYGFSMGSLGIFNVYLLTAISIGRYRIMCKPFTAPETTKSFFNRSILPACILFALFWATLPLLEVSSYELEGVGTSCGINWGSSEPENLVYITLLLVFCFLIPWLIMCFCYGKIFYVVRESTWKAKLSFQSQALQKKMAMEKKVTKMIALSGAAFLGAWTPYAVVAMGIIFGGQEFVPPILVTAPSIFAKSSVFWNASAFIYYNRKCRACFKSLFLRCCQCPPSNKVEPEVREVPLAVVPLDNMTPAMVVD